MAGSYPDEAGRDLSTSPFFFSIQRWLFLMLLIMVEAM
jgi:hypothetical protein